MHLKKKQRNPFNDLICYSLDLTATNISAVGLQQFITTEADFELLSSRFKVGIKVPSITVTGNYNVSGNVGGLIPLHGKGKLK